MYNRAGILKAGRKVVRGVQITFWRVCGWIFFGALYGGLEILWRGHTHWTMLVLAAVISIPLDIANDTVIPWETPLWLQAVPSSRRRSLWWAVSLISGLGGTCGIIPGWCSTS